MMRNLLMVLVLCIGITKAWAQSQTISGAVTSEGEGLPGVSVVLEGTSEGTVTNVNGQYTLTVSDPQGVLIFTFVGMNTERVEIGARSVIDLAMTQNVTELSEVVVTALGIEREKASLGYATQEVNSDKLQVVRQQDVRTALAGKVAGVQVIGSSGSTMGNSSIRIRGINGLNDGTGVLYVVDGTIVNPNVINMDDIESVNVLKGMSAAALYGERAAQGVVMMTTKQGVKNQPLKVEFNSTYTFEKVVVPFKGQNEYGGGYDQSGHATFHYDPNIHAPALASLDGSPMAQFWADESWGPTLDGTPVLQWDGLYSDMANYATLTPWSPSESDWEDFFDTGHAFNNNISFTGGSRNTTFRFSYGNIAQTGILANSKNNKHSFNFSSTTTINDKLEVTPQVNYSVINRRGRFAQGYANLGSNLWQWWQRQIDVDKLRNYKTPEGDLKSWNPNDVNNGDYAPSYWNSPYADLYENPDLTETKRLNMNLRLKYSFNDNIYVTAAARRYTYNYEWRGKIVENTYRNGLVNDGLADFSTSTEETIEDNYEFMAYYNNEFGKFSLNAMVGGNVRKNRGAELYMSTVGGLSDPNLFNISASIDRPEVTNEHWQREVRSLFGTASLGYNGIVYLDLGLRNDWSSTLSQGQNSQPYPTISTSFIFSELLEIPAISFGKVRAGYASVAQATDPYQVNKTYSSGTPYGNKPLLYSPNQLVNSNLKPVVTSEIEAGLEMQFLQRRLGFDFTVYKKESRDQIIELPLPGTTGASSALINAGLITSKGWELALSGTPIKSADWNLDLAFNIAKNEAIVNELYRNEATGQEITTYQLGAIQWDMAVVVAQEGLPWGTMILDDAIPYYQATDADGNPVDDPSNGLPIIDNNGYFDWGARRTDVEAGSVLPDFTGGFNGVLSWKNIALAWAMDFQKGGILYSLSQRFNTASGHSHETSYINDNGVNIREDVSVGGGVRVDGVLADGTPHTAYVPAKSYFKDRRFYEDNFVYDASYVKMREVSLTYTFGQNIVAKTPFDNIQFGLVLKNPWILYKDSEIDPSELENLGYENGQLPGTRSTGFNLRLNF